MATSGAQKPRLHHGVVGGLILGVGQLTRLHRGVDGCLVRKGFDLHGSDVISIDVNMLSFPGGCHGFSRSRQGT